MLVIGTANFFNENTKRFSYEPAGLCTLAETKVLRALPILYSIMFYVIFRKIKFIVLSQENATNFDEIKAVLALDAIAHVWKFQVIFLVVNIALFLLEINASLDMNKDEKYTKHCFGLKKDTNNVLSVFLWFLNKFIADYIVAVATLYMFWCKKETIFANEYFEYCNDQELLKKPRSTNQVIALFEQLYRDQEKAMHQNSFKIGQSLESLKNKKKHLGVMEQHMKEIKEFKASQERARVLKSRSRSMPKPGESLLSQKNKQSLTSERSSVHKTLVEQKTSIKSTDVLSNKDSIHFQSLR